MPKHIAIIEDEAAIAANYRDALSRQGYSVSVHTSRSEANQAFTDTLPDLAIIDVGLGDDIEGGFELCRDLRGRSKELPIIFLTARDSDPDVISGFRLGADDYISKDISQAQMMVRIVALLRRAEAWAAPEREEHFIHRGHLSLNLERFSTMWQEQLVDLTVTEFKMLQELAQRPGHVKSRSQLMEAAGVIYDDNTITSHIKRIRRKFQHIDPEFSAIETIYGTGYRWSGNGP